VVGDHGGASCASETRFLQYWDGFLNWSDLASKLDDALEKCRLQVQGRSGAVIDAMILLLQWDWKNAASALDTSEGSTAAVANMADPSAVELRVSLTVVDHR
jgi:hypothetical protein